MRNQEGGKATWATVQGQDTSAPRQHHSPQWDPSFTHRHLLPSLPCSPVSS